jgi:hypothetical protein
MGFNSAFKGLRKTDTDECMVFVCICVNQNIPGFTLVCLMLQLALHVAVLTFLCLSNAHFYDTFTVSV